MTWAMVLVVVSLMSCGAWVWAHFRIKSQLRTRHPAIFARLGFAHASALMEPEREEAEAAAAFALQAYLRSGEWRELGDAELATLVRTRRVGFWTFCAASPVCFLAFAAGW
jgi:hypothetical protein